MSGAGKKVADVAFKASKSIDWEGMAKMIVTDEARKEFSSLRRAFDEVNTTLQTKFSQLEAPVARVCGLDTPFPLVFEPFYMPTKNKILDAIKETVNY